MTTVKILVVASVLALSITGCGATSFEGSAYFPGGAPACMSHCASANMEMDSFVFMGAYSTACICRLKTAGGHARANGGSAGATSGAAVAGIVIQRQRAAAANAAAVNSANVASP